MTATSHWSPEEISKTWTYGFVFQPSFLPGFSLAVDYFDIEIDDVITAPSAQQILNACYDAPTLNNQFCPLFQRNASPVGPQNEMPFQILEGNLQQVVLNYASSRSRGVDVEATFPFEIPRVGRLNSRLVYTHTLQRDDFLDPGNPDRADQVLFELGDPKDAFNLDLDLDLGALSLSYQLRYIGKQLVSLAEDVTTVDGRPPGNADFGPITAYSSVTYSDVRAGYEFNRQWNFYVGVDNVADKLPPLGLTGTGGGSGIYEPRGRFFYGGARFKY